jgi:hypothetical protein
VSISSVQAVDLTWDASGSGDPAVTDGSGNWDLLSDQWFDGATNVAWTNGNTAIFGSPDNIFNAGAEQFNVDLAAAITAQDLIVGIGANGGGYTFSDFGGGSLTLNGNVHKSGGGGVVNFLMVSGPITLGAGNHTFQIRDTGGDASEITVNGALTGSGGVTVNNSFYEAWGTLGFTQSNSYTGATTLTKGRLVITDSGALGSTSAGTTIGNLGTLGLGGGGLTPASDMNIAEPITITRSVYDGGDFGMYGAAIYQAAGNNTLSGPITINTADARFRIEGGNSNLTITTNLVTAGKISISGGGPGSIELTGNNTGVAGGFNIRGGSLTASNHNNIGGPTSILTFGNGLDAVPPASPGGGGYLKIMNDFMTDFSGHVVNFASFSGGIDVQGTVFNITESIGSEAAPAGQLNKRGPGVLNLSGTNVMNGRQFIDAGTVNIKAGSSTGVGGLGMRNGVLNIEAGATYTSRNNNYVSIAIDSGENSTANVNGSFIVGDTDLNVSDLGNTTGTLNLFPGGVVETRGINFIAKNSGSLGTVNQTGGDYRVLRGGNFSFVLSDARGGKSNVRGIYNLSGGTFTSAGEVYVGEGDGDDATSYGTWNQSGGTATINNWFVIGRENSSGDVDISGGSLIKAGGGNTPIGEGTNVRGNNFTVRGTGLFDAQTGEVWVSNGNTVTNMTVKETGALNVNNYFVVGRFGNSKGTLNLQDSGVVNKAGSNYTIVAAGGGSTGTVNQTGGTYNDSTETWISDGGVGVWNFSAGTINQTNLFDVGHNGGGSGTFNVSGTAVANLKTVRMGEAGTVSSTFNLDGGTVKAESIIARNSTGTKTFNFNGGTLSVGTYTMPTALVNTGTGKLAPGGVGTAAATTITNGYTQGATASMAIDLGGSAAGAFDSIASTGAVALDGTLNLALIGGYNPTLLQTHSIITGSAVTGKFTTVGGVRYAANPSRGLAVTYTATSVNVTAARLGDTDLSGVVDFSDLLALAQNYGSTTTSWASGDFDGNGSTVFDDLLALAQNYGQSGVSLPTDLGSDVSADFAADWAMALSLVPEPTSLSVLGLAGLALSRSRRR